MGCLVGRGKVQAWNVEMDGQGAVTLVVDLARACEKVQLNVVCPGASLGKKKTMTTKEKFVVEENEKADELCWRKHIDTSSTPRGPTPP